jgi:hypothetical protein
MTLSNSWINLTRNNSDLQKIPFEIFLEKNKDLTFSSENTGEILKILSFLKAIP